MRIRGRGIVILVLTGVCGCAEPRKYWTIDLEKQERELLIKRDMVTAPEREAIDQQLKKIQNDWYIDLEETAKPVERSQIEEQKIINFNKKIEKQMREQLGN